MAKQYTQLELEVIGLKIAVSSINTMVNREMLDLLGGASKTEVHFPTSVHQRLFYVLLTDFLSKNTDKSLLPGNMSALEQINKISLNPQLTGHADDLTKACGALQDWLKKKVDVKLWVAALDSEITLTLTRQDIIYFAGNMSKHHFGHLTAITKQLYILLDDANRPRHDIIPALEGIYEALHDDILNYHASTIAELLNNLRWGIHSYLEPEHSRSYKRIDSLRYEFDVPKSIVTDFATACFWDLMNSVRSKPYIGKFTATDLLKTRY